MGTSRTFGIVCGTGALPRLQNIISVGSSVATVDGIDQYNDRSVDVFRAYDALNNTVFQTAVGGSRTRVPRRTSHGQWSVRVCTGRVLRVMHS